MSLPNMRILFKNMTDEEFKKIFNNNVFKETDILYKGKIYTDEEFKKERGDCLEQEELRW